MPIISDLSCACSCFNLCNVVSNVSQICFSDQLLFFFQYIYEVACFLSEYLLVHFKPCAIFYSLAALDQSLVVERRYYNLMLQM